MSAAKAQLHLVHGASYTQREAAIAASLARLDGNSAATDKNVVILEGLPDGQDILQATDLLHISRIAPGCFCCIGNLSLRVTLNRALRQKPANIYLGIASDAHLDKLLLTLQGPAYTNLLEINSTSVLSY
ncbi:MULTISPECIES: GTPase [Undibacterium]|uniref:GTPase n=1 Tax=Undibacterium umbellatum TaxID=2762300 RepID=A0ABR6Z931_9BURK|nr:MULTISPECIES: GTPase [Undibacterium]MBC3908284.1 GTPase [Undibacterium umbellatum]MDP1976100.1 GTPase [Undibacterium sp.]